MNRELTNEGFELVAKARNERLAQNPEIYGRLVSLGGNPEFIQKFMRDYTTSLSKAEWGVGVKGSAEMVLNEAKHRRDMGVTYGVQEERYHAFLKNVGTLSAQEDQQISAVANTQDDVAAMKAAADKEMAPKQPEPKPKPEKPSKADQHISTTAEKFSLKEKVDLAATNLDLRKAGQVAVTSNEVDSSVMHEVANASYAGSGLDRTRQGIYDPSVNIRVIAVPSAELARQWWPDESTRPYDGKNAFQITETKGIGSRSHVVSQTIIVPEEVLRENAKGLSGLQINTLNYQTSWERNTYNKNVVGEDGRVEYKEFDRLKDIASYKEKYGRHIDTPQAQPSGQHVSGQVAQAGQDRGK